MDGIKNTCLFGDLPHTNGVHSVELIGRQIHIEFQKGKVQLFAKIHTFFQCVRFNQRRHTKGKHRFLPFPKQTASDFVQNKKWTPIMIPSCIKIDVHFGAREGT